MSLAENHVATTYPLGRSSRRRRMLAIQLSSQNRQAAGVASSACTTDAPAFFEEPRLNFAREPVSIEDAFDNLRGSASPVTWLFVGDNFLPPGSGPRQWPGFVELFTAGLRNRLRPPFDPVVDACTPEFRARDALHGFRERIQERNPSVVFLLCGAADSAGGMRALAEFENALLRVARRLEEQDVLLVLNTSPVPYHTDDDPSAATGMIYAETVRGIATELDLPLVDHRGDWEQFAIPPGEYGSWFEGNGRTPSALGHRQIALKLISVFAEPRLAATRGFMSLVATSE